MNIKQQEDNVDTLYNDWLKIVNLCGRHSPQEKGMFKAYLSALRNLHRRYRHIRREKVASND